MKKSMKVDIEHLASLDRFFRQFGIRPSSQSEVVELSLEVLRELAEKTGVIEEEVKSRTQLAPYKKTNERRIEEVLNSVLQKLELPED